MTSRSPRQVAITIAQYLIALLALGWVLQQIDVIDAVSRLLTLDFWTIALILVVSLVGGFAQFDTWTAVLHPIKSVGLRSVASISLVVNFVNQLLPSRLSGRLAAPFVIRSQTGMKYADAAAVSGVHTGIYAVLYGVVSTAGLVAIASSRALSVGWLTLLVVSTGLYLLAGSLVLFAGSNLRILDPVVDWLGNLLATLPRIGPKLAAWVRGLTDFTEASTLAFKKLAANRRVWGRYAVSWSVVLMFAPAVRVWLMLQAFGVQFEPLVLLPLYLVTGYSVTLLPISPGGVGVTEATATAVFVALGVPSAVIVPVVFVDRIFGIYLPAAIGWIPAARLDLSSLAPD
ncbi:lysylphosphatidylglycerol synthase transmembrane domain-containing protein [Halodesulfurarchaeum sp.]|uniref:lysylphosphatidylglycerol synthase transmembrane domain-containing protein n=1 Tax=Halodesulfurarchaeum sp. TaxID=1980530 RepID=UPI001BC2775F|nr:flippase-like domain-containing protein [Halodesulfurarchaeum sp.]